MKNEKKKISALCGFISRTSEKDLEHLFLLIIVIISLSREEGLQNPPITSHEM